MDPELRDCFDRQLDEVMRGMPPLVHELLDEVPMIVEDYPSEKVMRQLGIRNRRQLCGLYTGIPLGERSVEQSGILSDAVRIYREGILTMAATLDGRIDQRELRKQIRITILHELGHHFGMTEEQLQQLGY